MLIYSFITDYQAFSLRYKDNTTRDKNETKVGKQSANLGKNNEPIQNRLSFLIDCKSVILHHLTILSFPMVRPAWDNWWLLKDDAASKDVVSEVFADVLNGKTQLCLDNETITSDSPLPSTNAGNYLLVCVRHKCLNLLSRQKMKDREIATELGISEVAVYKHLAQGIRKLKQKFNP